jgi:PAS domain S-box-containing protein
VASESREDLLERVRDLQQRLDEAEETLRALRDGEVDAVVASGPDGDRVYTLRGADEAYRVMVQGMAEGALTLTTEGLILFSNEQFATMVARPLEQVIGAPVQDFVAPEDADVVSALLAGRTARKAEVHLRTAGAALVPAYLSVENLVLDEAECLCVIVTNLSEQKRNQEIVAAEKLARSILEQAAEAILVVDPDGRITRASRAADLLAGTPVLQRKLDEVFLIGLDSCTNFGFREILSVAKRSRAIQDIEGVALGSDRRKIDLLLSAAILSGPDSGLLGCVIHLTDITELKRKERQLKFQADILKTTSEAVIAIDRNRRATFWNAGAERLFGLSAEDALGKGLADLAPYLWWSPENEQRVAGALEKHGTWSGENVHLRRDGTQVWVSATVNLISEEHGGGVFAVVRDITESKQAEAILRESEARERGRAAESQAIMEAVPAAVFIARDPECRDMIGNRMSYDLLRMPPGANISLSTPEGERPDHYRAMKNGAELPVESLPLHVAARTGQAVHDYEYEVLFDNGDARQLIGNAVPLFDEAGQSRGAVGAFIDITERKRAEQRLQQTQKLESIGLLAGGIAHDFNNQLVSVIGNAGLAQEMVPRGNPAVESLERIIKAGEKLAHLTGQMLAYAGKGRFLLERLDLSDLIPEMNGLIQPSIPKKIALHFELERNLPPIDADRSQVQQILMNLVLNASEAIGNDGGRISIKTGVRPIGERYIKLNPEAAELRPGTHVYLEVSDTGCGMDAATQARVFDPFFSTKFLGRGLGLAAVHGIVRSHKGAIEVSSAPGKGSCFTVLFPAAAQGALLQPADYAAGANGTGTVLVVDDDAGVRELAMNALTHRGYHVLLANDGPDAVETLKRHPGDISLVILDLSMPGMSGQEALPEIRKIRPEINVLISSGYDETETMALFKDQWVSGFIQKPYTLRSLAEKVKAAMG